MDSCSPCPKAQGTNTCNTDCLPSAVKPSWCHISSQCCRVLSRGARKAFDHVGSARCTLATRLHAPLEAARKAAIRLAQSAPHSARNPSVQFASEMSDACLLLCNTLRHSGPTKPLRLQTSVGTAAPWLRSRRRSHAHTTYRCAATRVLFKYGCLRMCGAHAVGECNKARRGAAAPAE